MGIEWSALSTNHRSGRVTNTPKYCSDIQRRDFLSLMRVEMRVDDGDGVRAICVIGSRL